MSDQIRYLIRSDARISCVIELHVICPCLVWVVTITPFQLNDGTKSISISFFSCIHLTSISHFIFIRVIDSAESDYTKLVKPFLINGNNNKAPGEIMYSLIYQNCIHDKSCLHKIYLFKLLNLKHSQGQFSIFNLSNVHVFGVCKKTRKLEQLNSTCELKGHSNNSLFNLTI